VAYCGLGVQEFLNLTPAEFAPILEASRKRRETEIRNTWEAMRLQTMFLVNIQLQKKDRVTNAEKFMPLPWDKETDDDDEDFTPPKIDYEAFKAFINGTKNSSELKPGTQHSDG
jgi:hypothetical protein